MTEQPAGPVVRRANKLITFLAIGVLVVVTVIFAAAAAAKSATYKSTVVLTSTVKGPADTLTSALQVLLPAVSVSVTSDPSKAQIAKAVPSLKKGWTIKSSFTPGTGLTTITVTASTSAQAQQLATAAVPVAVSAAQTITPGSVTRTIDPPTKGSSQKSRSILTGAAEGLAVGLVLMLLILFIGPFFMPSSGAKGSRRSAARVPVAQKTLSSDPADAWS